MTSLPYSAESGWPLPQSLGSTTLLERLKELHPKSIDLSLGRIERLLATLGHPERRLPPVVHVAGTNGKGSLIAFLRAIAEAQGVRVHVYTSPHLVHFHERIVLAGPGGGAPIEEAVLVECLARAEAANSGELVTLFEITTAAAFLAFADVPADLLLLETGLGGRLDATNVVEKPLATAITPISIDHVSFLGDTLAAIAGEKAGILKPSVPCIVARQEPEVLDVIEAHAAAIEAPLHKAGRDWDVIRAARPAGLSNGDDAARSSAAAPQRATSDRQCRRRHCRRQPRVRQRAYAAGVGMRTDPCPMASAAGTLGSRRALRRRGRGHRDLA